MPDQILLVPPRALTERGTLATISPEVRLLFNEAQSAAYDAFAKAHADMTAAEGQLTLHVKELIPRAVVAARMARERLQKSFPPRTRLDEARAFIASQRKRV